MPVGASDAMGADGGQTQTQARSGQKAGWLETSGLPHLCSKNTKTCHFNTRLHFLLNICGEKSMAIENNQYFHRLLID
jgi:hypothetical protein